MKKSTSFLLMLKHYSFFLKKALFSEIKGSTFSYKILRISNYMKEQKKNLKHFFQIQQVKNAFLPGCVPYSSRVHHCLLSRADEESPKRKTSKNGATSKLVTHSDCPCPSAEAATTVAFQKRKENQEQHSSTQVLLSKCKTQKIQNWHSLPDGKLVSWVAYEIMSMENTSHYRIHLQAPQKLYRWNKILPFLTNTPNCNSWEALKQVVWRAAWISYFVFQSFIRWKDLQRSFQAKSCNGTAYT